jgi:anthranilate phosphoribosyltransferase
VTTLESLGGWRYVLGQLIAGRDLSADEAGAAMGEVLAGDATLAQISSFVTGLRAKGETVDEMAGMVRAMLDHALPLPIDGDLVDTCGTGGDGSRSVNVSTMAAFVMAGAGVKVCKHGGRAATSAAGSADVLEALGVAFDLSPHGVARCVAETGMGFCFAPRFHPAMRFAIPVRRELGVVTVFNFLGPLANPARVRHQVVGVSDPAMAETMLGVLVANGCRRAMVVHGDDGLDELSTIGATTILEARADDTGDGPAVIEQSKIKASDLGLRPATLDDIRGGDASENAHAARLVMAGAPGPHRDIVVLNAAAGLVVTGMADDLAAGVERAATAIDDGSAQRVLEDLVRVSQEASSTKG